MSTGGNEGDHPWWASAVVYQVYPRSFADADADGIGDLPGLVGRLPYLAGLGVDAIWLSPFYPSPLNDGGYDVSDYTDVDPRLGTLGDFDQLIDVAREPPDQGHRRSGAQPLLVGASAVQAGAGGPPGSAERALFIFRDGRGPDGGEPPNNWPSRFGGRAWTRVPDGQWYLHLFDSSQPDWNWRDPRVGAMFEEILRFWLDRGVGGFRVDVAHGLFKDPQLADVADVTLTNRPSAYYHRPEVHAVYRRWREILDSYPSDGFPGARTAVGEVWADSAATLKAYLADDELPQIFNFDLVQAKWSPADAARGDRGHPRVRGRIARPLGHRQPRRGPPGHPVGRRRGPRGRAAAARAARLGLRLPGRGTRPARGRGHPRRRPAGSDLPPDRGEGGRPRRLPGPASLVSGRCFLRIFPNGPWL